MPQHPGEEEKPCRACSDFKTWSKMQGNKSKKAKGKNPPTPVEEKHKECPLDKDELGRSSWSLLHTMASYFPEKPNSCQTEDVVKFFNIFAQFYPCEPCAIDFQEDIKENPPQACSREALAKWLCDRHNTVNKKLGKPLFDCSKVHERWRDGWPDGSCD